MLDHVDEILVVSDGEQHLDIEISLAVLLLHFFQRIEESFHRYTTLLNDFCKSEH